jgi:hypothetical protein
MQEHRVEIRAMTSADDLERLLDTRPASWLRPFLSLAVSGHPLPLSRPWFRLGPREDPPDGSRAAWALRWRPRRGSGCFEDLVGRIVVDEDRDGTTFAIDATVLGGQTATTHRTLEALLELLDSALARRQDAG